MNKTASSVRLSCGALGPHGARRGRVQDRREIRAAGDCGGEKRCAGSRS